MSELKKENEGYYLCPACHSVQPVIADLKGVHKCRTCKGKIRGKDQQSRVCPHCRSLIFGANASIALCPCRENRWQTAEEAEFLKKTVRRMNQHRIPGSVGRVEERPGRGLLTWAAYWMKHQTGVYQCPYIQENGLRCPGVFEGPGYAGRCTVCGKCYHWCPTRPGDNKYAWVWRHICQHCQTRQETPEEDHNLHD